MDIRYTKVLLINHFKNLFYRKKSNKYLFIFSPPFCGSTLVSELISTSKKVSSNNYFGTREGQTLPRVKKIMFSHRYRWKKEYILDWALISKYWHQYWDLSKPILLEKSPPNIIRLYSIAETFQPLYSIIIVRNPYSHSQSLMSRNGWDAFKAAKFAVFSLKQQKYNINFLKKRELNFLIFRYEDITEDAPLFCKKIESMLPEVNDIIIKTKLDSHNFKGFKLALKNLNTEKISLLKQRELDDINEIFLNNVDLLSFFDYSVVHSL